MSTVAHPRAVFGVKKKNVRGVQRRAQAMLNGLTALAAQIPSPTIDLVTFLSLITALSTSQQTATETKARGSATLRDKVDAVWTAMESLQKFVQGLADLLPAADARALILAAGLVVADSTAATPQALLAATLTSTPGEVHLDANAALLVGTADARKNRFFNWEWSGDGGQTWNRLPSTPCASTRVTGLTLLQTYSFRVSVTISTRVAGPCSQAVSLLVH